MKILSRERKINESKSILIPCYLYEIVVDEAYGGNNILEEAVAKIIQLEPDYKNDIEKLAGCLGLKNSNNDIDYKALLHLVLNKICNQQTQEIRPEIKQYQIYQEKISNKILGIVTQDVDSFIEGEKQEDFIVFEKESKKQRIKLLKYNEEISQPTKQQIFEAIAQHNKNGDFKIKGKLDLEIPKSKEEIYLHCQVVLGEGRSFCVTNGFNSTWSIQLANILKEQCGDFLKKLRESDYTDEKKEGSYKEIYGDLRDEIAYSLQRFNPNKGGPFLYNGYEKYFEYLVKKNNYKTYPYNEAEATKKSAEEMGFQVEKIKSLFVNDGGKNLKSLLAKLIHNNDPTLQKIAKENPFFLMILSQLHEDRNVDMHGGEKKKTHKPLDEKKLNTLKELLEKVSHIGIETKEKSHSNNGYILMEREVDEDILNAMSDDNIKDLAEVYDTLDRCKDNQVLDLDTFSDVTCGLYKVCESVLLKHIQTYKENINEIREIEWLNKVKEYHIENAKRGENATLGAYTLVYLSINSSIKDIELSYIKRLLELRGHGNPTIDDMKETNLQELENLKKSIVDFITKILRNI